MAGEDEGEGGHRTKSEIRKAVAAQRARESLHSRKHTQRRGRRAAVAFLPLNEARRGVLYAEYG